MISKPKFLEQKPAPALPNLFAYEAGVEVATTPVIKGVAN